MKKIPSEWMTPQDLRIYVWFMKRHVDGRKEMAGIEVREDVEELRLVPGALLWAARRDALTKSKVAKIASRPIYRDLTSRNLNTTLKMLELMREAECA